MARRTSALAASPSSADNILRFDDAPEFHDGHSIEPPLEDMDQQVKEAQQRLATLRAQQEEVERQKHILENLRQKQERFVSGKREIVDKLDRSLRVITDALDEAHRRVESLTVTQRDFQDHLDQLRTFLPERWHRSQLDQELDRALHALNEAEAGFEKGTRRVHQSNASETAMLPMTASASNEPSAQTATFSTGTDDLALWLRRGFAFTLPLMATIILAMILAKLMF